MPSALRNQRAPTAPRSRSTTRARPAEQPRPARSVRALITCDRHNRGPCCAPIRGPDSMPIDRLRTTCPPLRAGPARTRRWTICKESRPQPMQTGRYEYWSRAETYAQSSRWEFFTSDQVGAQSGPVTGQSSVRRLHGLPGRWARPAYADEQRARRFVQAVLGVAAALKGMAHRAASPPTMT